MREHAQPAQRDPETLQVVTAAYLARLFPLRLTGRRRQSGQSARLQTGHSIAPSTSCVSWAHLCASTVALHMYMYIQVHALVTQGPTTHSTQRSTPTSSSPHHHALLARSSKQKHLLTRLFS